MSHSETFDVSSSASALLYICIYNRYLCSERDAVYIYQHFNARLLQILAIIDVGPGARYASSGRYIHTGIHLCLFALTLSTVQIIEAIRRSFSKLVKQFFFVH